MYISAFSSDSSFPVFITQSGTKGLHFAVVIQCTKRNNCTQKRFLQEAAFGIGAISGAEVEALA